MAITVLPPQQTGLGAFAQAFSPAFQQAQERQREQEKIELLKEQFKQEQILKTATLLADINPELADDTEGLIELATSAVDGDFTPIKIKNFNAKSEKKRKEFIKNASPSEKLFLEKNAELLDLPDQPVKGTESPLEGTEAFVPEEKFAPGTVERGVATAGSGIRKTLGAPLAKVGKVGERVGGELSEFSRPLSLGAKGVNVGGAALSGLTGLPIPQIPKETISAIQGGAFPNPLEIIARSGKGIGEDIKGGAESLFNSLPENIKRIIQRSRSQTGSPGAF